MIGKSLCGEFDFGVKFTTRYKKTFCYVSTQSGVPIFMQEKICKHWNDDVACQIGSCVANVLDVFVFAGNVHLGRLLSKPVRAQESAHESLTSRGMTTCSPPYAIIWNRWI